MKDFDTERRERHAAREVEMGDRSFTLGGETFTYRSVVSYTVLEEIAASSDKDGAELISSLEAAILHLLEDGQEERFLKAIRSPDDPFTFADLNDLATWLTEVQVGRPTQAPSLSTTGGAATSTPSTDDSSSPPAVVSAA
jgi:hypothetical protein